eukprot:SAG11_NODE_5649_length_1496_cov_2.236936_2_plen_305_part_00
MQIVGSHGEPMLQATRKAEEFENFKSLRPYGARASNFALGIRSVRNPSGKHQERMAPAITRSMRNSMQKDDDEETHIDPSTDDMTNMVQSENLEPNTHISRQLIISRFIAGDKQQICMLCDSGASVDFCAPEVYERLNPRPELQPSKIEIVLGNGDIQESSGSFTTKVILQSIPLDVTFHIMELPSKSFTAILGETFMYRHKAILNIFQRSISFAVEEKVTKEATRKQVAGVAAMLSQLPTATDTLRSGDEKQLDTYDGYVTDLATEGANGRHAIERNSDDVSSIELVSTKEFNRLARYMYTYY